MTAKWKDYVTVVDNSGWVPAWADHFIHDTECRSASYRNVDVNPSSMNKKTRYVKYNIFDETGDPILDCCYLRGRDLDVFKYTYEDTNTEGLSDIQPRVRVTKPVVYLGWINPHYGHFMMESLCRLWFLKDIDNETLKDSFFYFDIHTSTDSFLSKKWIKDILDVFGLNERNIIFGDKKYVFDEFIVPSQAMILHHGVVAEEQRYIWNTITSAFDDNDDIDAGRNIYLSRSGLARDKRSLFNEIEVQQKLSTLGFTVIHPEKLSFTQQVKVYSHADLMIGPSGSALHNAAFMRSGSRLISLTTRDFCLLNELLCCYAKQVNYSLFICEGKSKDNWTVPIEELLDYL